MVGTMTINWCTQHYIYIDIVVNHNGMFYCYQLYCHYPTVITIVTRYWRQGKERTVFTCRIGPHTVALCPIKD